jgi:hypothetical protein
MEAGFFSRAATCRLGGNRAYRAGIDASAAVDAGIGINGPLLAGFADGVYRAGIVTCSAIDALVRNFVCHFYSPPLFLCCSNGYASIRRIESPEEGFAATPGKCEKMFELGWSLVYI